MLQTSTKGIQEYAWLGKKGDPLGTMQQTKVWTCWQMIYTNQNISYKMWKTKFSVSLNYKQTSQFKPENLFKKWIFPFKWTIESK